MPNSTQATATPSSSFARAITGIQELYAQSSPVAPGYDAANSMSMPESLKEARTAQSIEKAKRQNVGGESDSMIRALVHKTEGGYAVQFPGVGPGRVKVFRAVEHGNLAQALEAARMWRDEQAVRVTELLTFPKERIRWGDGEIDDLAERVALIEKMTAEGMPFAGDRNMLHYLRAAIVQVLPFERWRQIHQVSAIPRDVVARVPKYRKRFAEEFARLNEAEQETRKPMNSLASSIEQAMMKAKIEGGTKSKSSGVPTIVEVLERHIEAVVEAHLKSLQKQVDDLAASLNARQAEIANDVGRLLVKADAMLTQPAPVAAPVSNVSPEDLSEIKTMQELLADELATVRRLSADIEDGKEAFDTRLRGMESIVFRLQASGVGAPSPGVAHVPIGRSVVPVIGIVGPLPDQFSAICERVGNAAQLVHIDNKSAKIGSLQIPKSIQYAVSNRFAAHSEDTVLRNTLGHERVHHVTSGGISSMVRTVMEIVERVNREGQK